MRNLFIAVAVLGLGLFASLARAEDKMTVTGVLIDTKCAAKMADEAAAAKHPAACAASCGPKCGMMLMQGDQKLKLDDASCAKACEYLGKDGAKTKVKVEATKNADGSLSVSSIAPAE